MEAILRLERRTGRRYDLRLPIHYRISQKGGVPRSGTGMTCDISTGGLSFRCRRPLNPGAHIEIVVNWPAKFGDLYPIDLQITGFVVRSDGNRTAVRLTSHRFRVDSIAEVPIQVSA